MSHYATYSPEDDKIRLYLSYRLSAEDYAPVKAAGFRSAPKQECVFAYWTPKAEDLALELCGEITDEDKSLVERAEERAERFEGYQESRTRDANQAHAAVKAIADGIPFGQPILVGHHSERHARKDAERIENGMRKAVQMWKTAEYWQSRAKGALMHAKYKERPDVRARRIKTLEAELNQCIARYTPCVTKARPNPMYIMQRRWNADKDAVPVQHVWVGPSGRGGTWAPVESLEATKASYARFEEHLRFRIEYERALLGEQIGATSHAERFDYAVGGRIRYGSTWLTILKLNKKDGQVTSLSTNNPRYPHVVPVEDIGEYEAPTAEQAATVQAATKRPPLCNYPGDGFASCTMEQWKKIGNDYKSTVHAIPATDTTARHCVRYAIGTWLDVQPKDDSYHEKINYRHRYYCVYITDAARKDPPALTPDTPPALPPVEREAPQRTYQPPTPDPEAAKFEALEQTLKAGIQVVSAPQLFPTPKETADYMVDLLDVQAGECVLEPSAGTGALIQPIIDAVDTEILAYEVNGQLCSALRLKFPSYRVQVRQEDFLEVTDFQGCYPKIIMNPPFVNGADIKHIQHAMTFLKPGGRLVALCANGPRQNEQLKPLADYWEELPAGTFKEQGTGVNVALMVWNKPALVPIKEPDPPTLAENAAEAQRILIAGRQDYCLREARVYDHTRAEQGPLFKDKGGFKW